MKRKIVISLAAFTMVMLMNFTNSNAQSLVGGTLSFGTEVESIGIGAVGEFYVTNEISIVPGFNIFFPGGFNFWEINANGHYHFETGGTATPYGLAGINVGFLSGEGDSNFSSTEIGLNIGVGSDFDIGSSWVPFAEIRFVISDFDQLVLSAGAKYTIR